MVSDNNNITAAQLAALKTFANQTKMICRAIDHKLRFEILETFITEGRKTVTELYIKLRIEQSVMSQHLAILREQGLVTSERDGKFIYYDFDRKNAIGLLKEFSKLDKRRQDA